MGAGVHFRACQDMHMGWLRAKFKQPAKAATSQIVLHLLYSLTGLV
jgi:hypothetical protein